MIERWQTEDKKGCLSYSSSFVILQSDYAKKIIVDSVSNNNLKGQLY